jgi:hypothetical protein
METKPGAIINFNLGERIETNNTPFIIEPASNWEKFREYWMTANIGKLT